MTQAEKWQAYLQTLRTNFTKLAKIEFLQPDNSVAFAIDNNPYNNRAGAFIQEGNLNVNFQNGQRRTASVTLANLDGAYDYNINKVWFGQRIRLQEGLILPDGSDFYLPQGVFYIKNPEEIFLPDQKTVTYSLADKWSYLDGTLFGNLEGVYEVPINSNIFTVIQTVLNLPRNGTTGGVPIDNTSPIFTNYYNNRTVTLQNGNTISVTLTPYTYRQDSENGTYADIILEMNTMLAGWVGYDQTGALRLDPSQEDIADQSKPIQWAFSPSEQQFLGATYTIKNTELYNDIIVIGESLDNYKQAGGRAVNEDLSSDTNIFGAIGRKIKRYLSSGYYSNQQCEDLAAFYLKRNSTLKKSVSIQSTQMFHLIENNLVTIRRPDKPGAPVERHLITGLTRPISQTGQMTINATSVQDYPMATFYPLPWNS